MNDFIFSPKLILFTFVVFCCKILKDNKRFSNVLSFFYIIIGITFVAIAPQIVQPTNLIWFGPRSTYSFASMYGVLILYLAMGWLVLFCGGFLYMSAMSFGFVLAGGIIYSIGCLLYAIGKKNLNLHGIFHIFVLVSTIVQSIGVLSLFF